MQVQAQNKMRKLLDGFLSIYEFDETIHIPYQEKNSVAKSLYGHWNTVGDYLQFAMTEFDHEQKTHNT
ncbi:hypothetical protein SPBRAN_1903 [uncultured Candidatus Thioglobus sp.]|nr:hypothetical protein SPBRAN_1903 [uncultured Candidatus Thioglobus sp.]